MKKKGFTLVELLAVIVILAVILVIAIPQIMSVIKSARLSSIKDSAILIAEQAEKDYLSQQVLNKDYNSTSIPCTDVAKLNDDYASCSIKYKNGIATVKLKGSNAGKFANLQCTGTKDNMNCKEKLSTQITETIYWALQDNDGDNKNETLIISDSEVTGNKSGNFNGNSKFVTYSSRSSVPWIIGGYQNTDNLSYNVTNVMIEGEVSPSSTAYWFYGVGYHAPTFEAELSDLNTENVTDMGYMFNAAGYWSTTFDIKGLENWDTSDVTNMKGMFYSTGTQAQTWSIGDIGNWDTSNVTNMSYMFDSAGHNATTWSIGDISNWDTSKVTDMSSMFYWTGRYATTFNLDLSNWDTSNVTNMKSMFWGIGEYSTTFDIKGLNNWDTSNVTNMSHMFIYSGRNATTFNLDLSNWDTSSVTDMSSMFWAAGENATTWSIGDLSNWNTSNVTNMSSMFYYAGRNATIFNLDLSNWNTSNVTNMKDMFSGAGYDSSTWSIKIPKTNGNGIDNTTTRMYGKTTSTYVDVSTGKTFTLAS